MTGINVYVRGIFNIFSMTFSVITYIFLNCVGVLNAEDSFTHQNGLLLVTEGLQVNTRLSFSAIYSTVYVVKTAVFLAYLSVVSHDVIKACQQAQASTDLYVHGSVHIVEEVESFVDQLAALLQKTWKRKRTIFKLADRARFLY